MSLDDRFIALVEEESPLFRPVIDAMFHSCKNEGRRYLCALNNVVDWCLNSVSREGDISLQVIHIPSCPDWARELLVRFMIHKAAFTFNRATLDRFKRSISSHIVLPTEITKKAQTKVFEERKYRRKIASSFVGLNIPNNVKKSLFIVKEHDVITRKQDRNPWLDSLYSTDLSDVHHNTIVSTDSSDFLEERIRAFENIEDIPVIENVFIFTSSNRGSTVNHYNIDQLRRLNKYGLGIKHCIVFSFSHEPCGLYNAIEGTKYRIATGLLNKTIRAYDEFDGFITFSSEEMNYLFNRQDNQQYVIIDCPDRSFFTVEIDSILEQIPHNLKYKNALALAFSSDLQRQFWDDTTTEIPNANIESCADFFNLLQQVWYDDIKAKVDSFLEESQDIAFIVPRETTKATLLSLWAQFATNQRQIRFYALEEMNKGIEGERVVVLQYRYTDKLYKSYPNSFDPLPLKEYQKALVTINLLTHNDYYEWNRHRYYRDFNGLLYSSFRKELLGWSKRHYQRPALPDIRNYIDEAEADSREYQIEKCTVQYVGGKTKEYPACERVIYKKNDCYCITELKDIDLSEELGLQMLDELVEQVKSLISRKVESNSGAEKYIKSDSRYNLSDEEIDSNVELWKILLSRKVEELGGESVYDAIGSSNVDVSFNGFKRWYDLGNPMILPRSRKSQRALLSFLGFALGSPYHRIVLAKKLFNISNSRSLNSQIAALLQNVLTREITPRVFENLLETHSDILTLLDVTNAGDIEALVDLIDIDLKPAIRIEYDPN